jgi:hypothetical protein
MARMRKIANFWNCLPHQVQALIVCFAGAVVGTLAKALDTPNVCLQFACWKEYLRPAISVGVTATAGLYIRSSFYTKSPPPQCALPGNNAMGAPEKPSQP